jgi:hypothetical protein
MIRYRDKYKVKSLPLFIKEVKIFPLKKGFKNLSANIL